MSLFTYIASIGQRSSIATGILTIGTDKIMYWPNGKDCIYYNWYDIKNIQLFYHGYKGQPLRNEYGQETLAIDNGDKNYIIIQQKKAPSIRINFHLTKEQSVIIKQILHQCCEQTGVKLYMRNR